MSLASDVAEHSRVALESLASHLQVARVSVASRSRVTRESHACYSRVLVKLALTGTVCIIYNIILRYIWEKYKPGNEVFCLEISPSSLWSKGDISSESPELPGLYFPHVCRKIMLCIIYLTIIFPDAILSV